MLRLQQVSIVRNRDTSTGVRDPEPLASPSRPFSSASYLCVAASPSAYAELGRDFDVRDTNPRTWMCSPVH